MDYIDANPLERTPVDELARQASLNKKYFSKLFKLQSGLSPKSYQVRARMNYAQFLLEDTDMRVNEVATSLGYPDPFIFSKQFKVCFGYPPVLLKK